MNFKCNKFLIALSLMSGSMLSTAGYATTFYDTYDGALYQQANYSVGGWTPANVFTSSATGNVTDIQLYLGANDASASSITFIESIYGWNGTIGTLLQSDSVSVSNGYSGLVDFASITGLSLTAGSEYYLSVAANTGSNSWFSHYLNDNPPPPYVTFYENGSSIGFGSDAAGDAIISGTAAVVPVPAAVWLFGSALAGFIGFNRRKSA